MSNVSMPSPPAASQTAICLAVPVNEPVVLSERP